MGAKNIVPCNWPEYVLDNGLFVCKAYIREWKKNWKNSILLKTRFDMYNGRNDWLNVEKFHSSTPCFLEEL